MQGKTRERDDCFEQQVLLLGGAVSDGGQAVLDLVDDLLIPEV